MNFTFLGALTVVGILGATLCLLEIGRRLGARRLTLDPDGAKSGAGAVEGAVFALMGLLIAFTFSGGASRFDARREVAIEEANCIGTAWMRLDLLPAASRTHLRNNFREYLNARLDAFDLLPDLASSRAALARAEALQAAIWKESIEACQMAGSQPTTTLVLTALNQMFDAAVKRTVGAQMHPPPLIYCMLGVLVLVGSLLAGYGMSTSRGYNWFHGLAFAVVLTLTIYVILDYEFPRMGLIRIDDIDQVFRDLQKTMRL